MKINDIAEIITPKVTEKDSTINKQKVILSAGLKENNDTLVETVNDNVLFDTSVYKDDIIVKRVSPQYVNLIDRPEDKVYYGNNLMIIRLKNKMYHPSYIAYVIEKKIPILEIMSNSGTRFYSINKKMLENIIVPEEEYSRQVYIGKLWDSLNKRAKIINLLQDKNDLIKKMIYEKI
jgi:hypothetical protein